ncbi:3-deoxy-D-manno-octulosonic acid transferase [Rhodobacteraceae bacterium NNCM2]|nr:3-deoxy-D-manno-octulosonic acid transferase [Coraliihabitans acroporae]
MAFSLALTAYRGLSQVIDWPVWLLLRRRLKRGKEDPVRIAERRGFAGCARPPGRLVWLHGASIGEAMSILPLVAAIRQVAPETCCLVTTGTVTSARRMEKMLPPGALHQFVPVDTAASVRRFLDHWRPDAAIWVESEFWPRLMTDTAARGIPMALVNARVSAESAGKWARFPTMIAGLLACFRLIVTQDRETRDRLVSLGAAAEAIRVGGNLKALAPLPEPGDELLARARSAVAGRPVWLAASTHPGEEEIALDAQCALCDRAGEGARPLLILAPRHPERAGDVAALIAERGLSHVSAAAGEEPGPETDVWLADTLGQMGLWLRLAPVTLVGGSLAPHGGHTPFEPTLLGSAILHGPHTENFGPAYAALAESGGAIAVADAASVAASVAELQADEAARASLVAAAQVLYRDVPDPVDLAREILAMTKGAP